MRTTRPDLRARTGLGIWPTPLQSADNQAGIYVKREDLCGFAFGGSKVRALQPLLGEALGRQARTIVTGGRRRLQLGRAGRGSDRAAGAALPLRARPWPVRPLATAVAERFGARVHTAPEPGAQAVNAAIAALADELGPSAYPIPRPARRQPG